jgi:hypothetical protein
MKRILFIATLLSTVTLMAQTKYETAMQNGLNNTKAIKTPQEANTLAAYFERIGDAEKTQWLPYYYAANNYILAAWMGAATDKDKAAEKINKLITKAEAIEKENSEIYCLKQQLAVLQLTVDPSNRWQAFGAKASEAIAKAKILDPTNPRPYFLEGQYLLNVPEAFGGGKAVAKKIFEKAISLYSVNKPASALHPSWGKAETEKALAACL